ncbi:uncharacterized protein LOC132738125 isoform X2 [Ruditapes philippinarum]|uniref:uncharacterized protein LOC132738125 isoform X2 n=1 Tax=Ruditapes philippinarum TaxID=129788 RepID=UPI00295B85C7|nr:uncharacterized protein LOC132738125 isoform X2 [Ruditapes philippinarum]
METGNSSHYDGNTVSMLITDGVGKPRKKRSRYILAAVMVVCLLALVVGIVVWLSTKDSSDSSNSQSENEKQEGESTRSTQVPVTSTTRITLSTRPSETTSQNTGGISTRHTTSSESTTQSVEWLSRSCVNPDSAPKCPWRQNPLVLVSLDGFQAEYLLRNLTPTIEKLRDCGVHTPYMRAVYPTLTFPNHYTIVTGLYPESHGIVGNSMYDPHLNQSFSISSEEKFNSAWWGGEPLWVTAKKQGKRTASYFWVGSEMNISGVQPDIWKPYDGKIPYEDRVDTVLDWIDLPDGERPDFITLYFDEPDHVGHGSGPNSEQVNSMLSRVDGIIGRLMNGLLARQKDHCVNLIVLADHGMAETSCERQVVLSKYLDGVDDMLIYSGTTGHINPRFRKVSRNVYENENVTQTKDIIDSLKCKNSHLNIFSRSSLPARHHYANNDRIGEVVLDIEQSWLVYPTKRNGCLKGNHGYDNIYKSMHALFLAHGPGFKQNLAVEAFENIELYNLMAELLSIKPAPNNGTAGTLDHLLQNPLEPSLPVFQPPGLCTTSSRSKSVSCHCNDTNDVNHPNLPGHGVFPFGQPAVVNSDNICALHGQKYSSFYSKLHKAPVISSFTLTSDQVRSYSDVIDDCLIADTRISTADDPKCSQYVNSNTSVDSVRFFNPGFLDKDKNAEALLSSNKVPMYTGFRAGIWAYTWRVVKEYAIEYHTIHVTVGPIYDHDFDGLMDTNLTKNTIYVDSNKLVPLPSHFYVILAKCSDSLQQNLSECNSHSAVDVLSFVLPHQNKTNNCLTNKDFLLNNIARIRDIEQLTGQRFLTTFSRSDNARSRTFLPPSMWPSPLMTPWEDLPCPIPNASCPAGSKPLLLISLDGFRADYLGRHLTPTIERLAKCGVHTPYMRSVYPTVTFPNHYTIVTGLYPESHGIVSNNMYDEEIDKIFSLSAFTAKDSRWWKGEPLWITAKKQGLKTATYFWPGSDVNISGIYPDIWKHYDGKAGYSQRVYDVLDWLSMPEDTRPDFVTLYFDEPDHAGHNSGPESEEVDGQLETVDELIHILMSNLYEKGLHNCINMIVLADHGMSPQSCERTVRVKDYYQDIDNMLMFDRVFGQIFPQFEKDSRYDAHRLNASFQTDDIVDNLMCQHPAMKVFTKDTMPIRHHYTNSNRIGTVSIDMKDEWLVLRDKTTYCNGGNHGWDNTNKNMHALFLAHGPAFRDNFTAVPFENIELYNLMTEVLNISAAPNNGTQGSLHYILRSGQPLHSNSFPAVDRYLTNKTENLTFCKCPDNKNLVNSDVFLESNDSVLLFGVPTFSNKENGCLLHQKGFSTVYSHTFQGPIMLSTKLNKQTPNFTSDSASCILNDYRVNSDVDLCSIVVKDSALELFPILDLEVGSDTYLSSSIVSLYTGFQHGIWTYLLKLLSDYKSLYGEISLTVGTIYDYNNDGLWEGLINETRYADKDSVLPVPTHIYAILIKCKTVGEVLPCDGNIDILPFVLPNLKEAPNCLRPDIYLKDNVARIRDIELLTGLQFMTSFDVVTAARLRTFLPEDIWDTSLPRSWSDEQCPHKDLCQSDYKPTLLISLDGFRADYLLRNMTPTISRLSQCGVHAPYMRSVYPTKTFPNHYSIVTGLYPESHGIIDNNMYDINIGKRFYLGSETSSDPRWWGGEPIWLTAKRQGIKTATYFWPGSDVKIQGEYPDIFKKYDGSIPYSSRVRDVISWMSLPEGERPDFITLYFDEPDLAGHKHGPSDEAEIGATLERVDETIEQLMDGLFNKKLHHCVNIIIIADHGMDDVSCSKIVRLSHYVDKDYLSGHFYVWEGPFGRIANDYRYNSTVKDVWPTDNPEPYDALLSNLTCASPHMNVFQKTSLPVRHHYTNNARIDDTILDIESGWLVTRNWINNCRGGNHGYDNIYKSMEALFLAYGPAFKWNKTIEPFENIELYNMFTDILNITAAPNNGTKGSLNHILKETRYLSNEEQQNDDYHSSTLRYKDAGEFVSFVQSNPCGGDCKHFSETEMTMIFKTVSEIQENSIHLPFGQPKLKTPVFHLRNVTLLYQEGFALAFDDYLNTPVWISQTFNGTHLTVPPEVTRCYLPDPRIEKEYFICDPGVDVMHTPLNDYFQTARQSSSMLTSGLTWMKSSFYTNIWKPVVKFISEKISKTRSVNILLGPLFDDNHDSLPDDNIYISNKSLPSHFFIVLTNCQDHTMTVDHCEKYHVESYIIPHLEYLKMCKDVDTFLRENEARMRDVEILSGLDLLSSLPSDVAIRLKTSLPLTFT